MSEDTNNLPDVDFSQLREFVSEGNAESAPVETPAPEVSASGEDFDLGQFKTPKDVLKGYKEIQGFTGKLVTENKQLKDELQSLREQVEMIRYQIPPQQAVPQQNHAGNWDFDKAFIENAGGAVAAVAKGVSEATVQQAIRTQMIEEVLWEEEAKDTSPDKSAFRERYAFAMQLRNQYPNLVASKGGVKKLFELADKARDAHNRNVAEKTLKTLVGEDVDLEKFKAMVKKDGASNEDSRRAKNLAFMPDTGGGARARSDSGTSNIDRAINDAVSKGDVDTVVQGLFHKVLSDTG